VARRAHRLRKDDPRTTKKFVELFKESLLAKDLIARADKLSATVCTPPTPEEQALYDQIDKEALLARLAAENGCRKLCMGAVPWTLVYQLERDKKLAWELLICRRLKGCHSVDSKYLSRVLKKAQIQNPFDLSTNEYYANLKVARKFILASKKTAHLDRPKWLDAWAAAEVEASGNKLTVEKELEMKKQIKQQRRDARIIQRASGKLQPGGLTSVVAPDSQGNWVELTKKEDIERALCAENACRVNQAKDTPLLQEPLFSEVGPLGFGPASQAILEGTYVPPLGTDPWVVKLLPHLAMPQAVKDSNDSIPAGISLASHTQLWSKMKEQTSAGPSGATFAHFIAGSTDPIIAAFDATLRDGLSPQQSAKLS
jgi:hypothetical protein